MAFAGGLVVVLAALVCAAEAQPPAPDWVPRLISEGEAACGFFPLFNGSDLDGWIVNGQNKGAFSASGNALCALYREDRPWLVTREPYENFELHFAFRMLTEDGQSLVGFGIGSDGPNAIQMLHGPAGMNKPLAEWNEVEVGCRGGELKMAVNGADCGGGASRPGFIGIQCSCGRVEFRGLRIKPLPGGEGWRTLDGNSLPAKFELRFRFKPLADSRGGVVFVSGQKTVFEIRIDNRDMEEFTGSLAGKVGALELRALDDSWNHMRIAVDGPNIRVWVNGMTVVDFVSTGRMSCAGAATRFNVDRGSIEFEDIEIKTKE